MFQREIMVKQSKSLMKSNYDITVEMKIQNFGYLINFRDSRTPNSKYGRFGSFLGRLVLFSLSLWEICKLECILELTKDTKLNEKQKFQIFHDFSGFPHSKQ